MSLTNSTEDNWLLIQTRYDYMALPVEVALEALKHMRVVSMTNGKVEVSNGEVSVKLIGGDQMTVALVKAKMTPKEGE
jgi:hypothetical protein